jgi:hypothetical protein
MGSVSQYAFDELRHQVFCFVGQSAGAGPEHSWFSLATMRVKAMRSGSERSDPLTTAFRGDAHGSQKKDSSQARRR